MYALFNNECLAYFSWNKAKISLISVFIKCRKVSSLSLFHIFYCTPSPPSLLICQHLMKICAMATLFCCSHTVQGLRFTKKKWFLIKICTPSNFRLFFENQICIFYIIAYIYGELSSEKIINEMLEREPRFCFAILCRNLGARMFFFHNNRNFVR